MQVVCAHCGGRFEAQRSSARYCSTKHRMAAAKARRSSGNVIPMAPVASKKKRRLEVAAELDPVASTETPTTDDVYDTVDALKLQFRGTSVLKTPLGQVALKLARIIDLGKPDGSISSEVREFRQVVASLGTAGRAEDDNPLSRRRRARDRSAAGD